jgi:DNA-binding NarL/FixJ family response regulator
VRILIADDHESVRKGISSILAIGFTDLTCDEAANGLEAIRLAKVHPPDLIILDINMPVLSGFAAAAELQKLLPHVPILFFTMHTGPQFIAEARKAKVQGFVAKDRAGDTLIEAARALMRNETYFPA